MDAKMVRFVADTVTDAVVSITTSVASIATEIATAVTSIVTAVTIDDGKTSDSKKSEE